MLFDDLVTKARKWKQTQWPSADEKIVKSWHIYTKKYYLAIENLKLLKLKVNEYSYGVVWMKAPKGSYVGLPKSTHTHKMCLNGATM